MLFALALTGAHAADHGEAPTAAADPAADINDFYAWAEGGELTLIMTVQPDLVLGGDGTYDADVLYMFHVDTDGDNAADTVYEVRFGSDGSGNWGVQAMEQGVGLVAQGPVTAVNVGANGRVFAGPSDDPFFFDLTGFVQTASTGTIAFDNSRDSFAGQNVLSIALRVPAPSAAFQTWATTGRL